MNKTVSCVLGAKRLLVFADYFFTLYVGDSAVLRQFNNIITNKCGIIYGITIKGPTAQFLFHLTNSNLFTQWKTVDGV